MGSYILSQDLKSQRDGLRSVLKNISRLPDWVISLFKVLVPSGTIES